MLLVLVPEANYNLFLFAHLKDIVCIVTANDISCKTTIALQR